MTKWKLNKQIQLTNFCHSACTSKYDSPLRRVTETIGASGAKKKWGEKWERRGEMFTVRSCKTSGVHFLFY